MPLVRMTCSEVIGEEKKAIIMKELSKRLSSITGKPEEYILIIYQEPCDMMLGGSDEKSLFLEIKSIGSLDAENTKRIAKNFCRYLSEETGVPSSRINIEFRDVEKTMWGWNGKTFA
ncbi:MAG: hypothetical protein JW928_00330 [Candidatus Aureabacteria bacterium]|nr:hypothetical protein [Candidatus Auribacterota bacterium]